MAFLCNSSPSVAFAQVSSDYIENTASVSFNLEGTPSQLRSNTVYVVLRPLVDVEVMAERAQADAVSGEAANYSYGYIVSNPGNRADQFELTAAFTDRLAPMASLWVDVDGDGRLDPTVDRRIDPAHPVLGLAAGARVRILVRATEAGTMRLTATSLNTDPQAVVRHRSASATNSVREARPDEVTLTKSQAVDGSARRGSLITYRLEAHIPASSAITDIRVSDVVPDGTTYVPNTLFLNSERLSDEARDDAGQFDAATQSIEVMLPEAVTVSTHIVQFQVRIN